MSWLKHVNWCFVGDRVFRASVFGAVVIMLPFLIVDLALVFLSFDNFGQYIGGVTGLAVFVVLSNMLLNLLFSPFFDCGLGTDVQETAV